MTVYGCAPLQASLVIGDHTPDSALGIDQAQPLGGKQETQRAMQND